MRTTVVLYYGKFEKDQARVRSRGFLPVLTDGLHLTIDMSRRWRPSHGRNGNRPVCYDALHLLDLPSSEFEMRSSKRFSSWHLRILRPEIQYQNGRLF
jgi:hypothetical protein